MFCRILISDRLFVQHILDAVICCLNSKIILLRVWRITLGNDTFYWSVYAQQISDQTLKSLDVSLDFVIVCCTICSIKYVQICIVYCTFMMSSACPAVQKKF